MFRSREYLYVTISGILMSVGAYSNAWPPFLIIYGFWLETWIICFFDSLKIFFANGENQPSPHAWTALKYLLFKTGVLLFYFLFMVVFIALMHGDRSELVHIVQSVFLRDKWFNLVVSGYVVGQLIPFANDYWKTERVQYGPGHFKFLIDARTIFIHIMIVGGTFLFMFMAEHFPQDNNYWGRTSFVLLFVLLKWVMDMVVIKMKNIQAKRAGVSSTTNQHRV